MTDKKQNGLIVVKVFKHAQEKQSESLFIVSIVYYHRLRRRGYVPLSKPHENSLRAAMREKWVTFYCKESLFC